jgi:hypothetical protein
MWLEADTALSFLMWSLYYLGEFAQLSRRVPAELELARQRGDNYASIFLASSFCTVAFLVDDDVERAKKEIERASAGASRKSPFHSFWIIGGKNLVRFYTGDVRATGEWREGTWRRLKKTLLLRTPLVRFQNNHFAAKRALAAATDKGLSADVRRGQIDFAARLAASLAKEDIHGSPACALLIEASLASLSGRKSKAVTLLARAEDGFFQADMRMYALSARRRRGELMGGEKGEALVESVDAAMFEQSVKRPERITAMLAPGFERCD